MIPNELIRAVLALSHKTRWDIIAKLQQQQLSYTELLNNTGMRKGSLTHHLNKLMDAGLIDNFSQGTISGPYSSYYRLSRFGKDFLTSLISSIEIPLKEPETNTEDAPFLTVLHNEDTYKERSIVMRAFGIPQSSSFKTGRLIKTYDNKAETSYMHITKKELKR